jgi:hypothetical protein
MMGESRDSDSIRIFGPLDWMFFVLDSIANLQLERKRGGERERVGRALPPQLLDHRRFARTQEPRTSRANCPCCCRPQPRGSVPTPSRSL